MTAAELSISKDSNEFVRVQIRCKTSDALVEVNLPAATFCQALFGLQSVPSTVRYHRHLQNWGRIAVHQHVRVKNPPSLYDKTALEAWESEQIAANTPDGFLYTGGSHDNRQMFNMHFIKWVDA